MKDLNQFREEIINTLSTLREDAEMAIDGRWEITGYGLTDDAISSFESQIRLIDEVLNLIEDEKEQTLEESEEEE
jgi:hypothetical protein